MQYLALIYSEDGAGPRPGTPEWDGFMQGYAKANKAFREEGAYIDGQPLEHTSMATSVRVRNGKVEITWSTKSMAFAFVSATPGPYEFDHSDAVVEQVVRPTGLLDPVIEVRPVMQIELPE